MTIQELEVAGLTHLQALRLHSALLLADKLKSVKEKKRCTISSPKDGADYLMNEMKDLKQEHFVVIYLNTKNEVIHQQTLFIGSLNTSIIHPREVFNVAVRHHSASIIVAHNHPSGNPKPSPQDIQVTKRLVESGRIMGIEVLDSLIIGQINSHL